MNLSVPRAPAVKAGAPCCTYTHNKVPLLSHSSDPR
jgi:hypothetical protein